VKACEKKNSRVYPCFTHLKIFKTALMGDIKPWSNLCRRHRHRRYRRHRRSRSNGEKKEKGKTR
jgi:hypothetical protein